MTAKPKEPAELVAEVRERLERATPGPWKLDRSRIVCRPDGQPVAMTGGEADDALISHAPSDLAALCDAVERLQRELQQLRAERAADPVRRFLDHRDSLGIERVGKNWRAVYLWPPGAMSGVRDSYDEVCAAALDALDADQPKSKEADDV